MAWYHFLNPWNYIKDGVNGVLNNDWSFSNVQGKADPLDSGINVNTLYDEGLGTNQAQYQQQKALMDKANAFNEQMASTQYQRAKDDMIKAGINPILAFAQNGGAAMASAPTSAGAMGMSPTDFRRSATHNLLKDLTGMFKAVNPLKKK